MLWQRRITCRSLHSTAFDSSYHPRANVIRHCLHRYLHLSTSLPRWIQSRIRPRSLTLPVPSSCRSSASWKLLRPQILTLFYEYSKRDVKAQSLSPTMTGPCFCFTLGTTISLHICFLATCQINAVKVSKRFIHVIFLSKCCGTTTLLRTSISYSVRSCNAFLLHHLQKLSLVTRVPLETGMEALDLRK